MKKELAAGAVVITVLIGIGKGTSQCKFASLHSIC